MPTPSIDLSKYPTYDVAPGITYTGQHVSVGDIHLQHGYGRAVYNQTTRNGVKHSTYTGYWNMGYFCGNGELWEANETYSGEFKSSTKHGVGVVKFRNGDTLTGRWLYDIPQYPMVYFTFSTNSRERRVSDPIEQNQKTKMALIDLENKLRLHLNFVTDRLWKTLKNEHLQALSFLSEKAKLSSSELNQRRIIIEREQTEWDKFKQVSQLKLKKTMRKSVCELEQSRRDKLISSQAHHRSELDTMRQVHFFAVSQRENNSRKKQIFIDELNNRDQINTDQATNWCDLNQSAVVNLEQKQRIKLVNERATSTFFFREHIKRERIIDNESNQRESLEFRRGFILDPIFKP